MTVAFSIVYPTRNRPAFLREALQILAEQGRDDFQVVVSDNPSEPAGSAAAACRDSALRNLIYVQPPAPVGMVANWGNALPHATGEYVLYLTDKMFLLPGALRRIEAAIEAAGRPEIVSWTSDEYDPLQYPHYLGRGYYRFATSRGSDQLRFRHYSPREELDRRGQAEVSRQELSAGDYSRGKLVFGAYRRDLIERIEAKYGSLFHNINPDYTSMVLGLAEARDAIELAGSCVVSVITDLSNGDLGDADDRAARGFLDSLEGGIEAVGPRLMIPGLYASQHNWVAHDYLSLRDRFGLDFEVNQAHWIAYCWEDIHRPDRRWSSPDIERDQTAILADYLAALDPTTRAAVESHLAKRRARRPTAARTLRLGVSRRLPDPVRRVVGRRSPLRHAVAGAAPLALPHDPAGRRTIAAPSIADAVVRAAAELGADGAATRRRNNGSRAARSG